MLYLLYLNYTVYQEQEYCIVHVIMSFVGIMKQDNGKQK